MDSGALAGMIEARRKALGLTYRELADACGLSLGTVYKIANGQRRTAPLQNTLTLLARGLNLPRELLLEAMVADQGIQILSITRAKRQRLYLTSARLTEGQLDAVQAVIDQFRLLAETDEDKQ
jgi:transcriptional regulator with XRE-family HTH domain